MKLKMNTVFLSEKVVRQNTATSQQKNQLSVVDLLLALEDSVCFTCAIKLQKKIADKFEIPGGKVDLKSNPFNKTIVQPKEKETSDLQDLNSTI